MNLEDHSIMKDTQVNKSYQDNEYHTDSYFKSSGSGVLPPQDLPKPKEEVKINPEIEFEPKKLENWVEEIKAQEWENVELFSSK